MWLAVVAGDLLRISGFIIRGADATRLPQVLDSCDLLVHKMKVDACIGPNRFLYAAPYNGVCYVDWLSLARQ